MLRGFSCDAAGDWMKTQPLLMLRPPSKALVSESPNAHMRDVELDSMSQAVFSRRQPRLVHFADMICFE